MRRLGPALEERDFRLWWLALLGMGISLQMLEVAIGWEVYALHRSALDLGWIGLAEFVPLFVLALPAGQLADRVPRRLIFAGSLMLAAAVAVGLALVSASGTTEVWPYLALAVGAGVAMALGWPAARAMPPTLVSADLLQNAMTLRSIASQSGQVIGPAVGGLVYGLSPVVVYSVEMVFISASNQLGAFESGLAAYLVGTVPAVVGGGVMTILIALSWGRFFPALAEVDRLEDVRPAEPARAPLRELVA